MLKELGSHVISHFPFVMFIPHLFLRRLLEHGFTPDLFVCGGGLFKLFSSTFGALPSFLFFFPSKLVKLNSVVPHKVGV